MNKFRTATKFQVSPPFRVVGYLPGFRAMISEDDGSVIGFRGRQCVRLVYPFSNGAPQFLGHLVSTLKSHLCVSKLATRLLRQTPYDLIKTSLGTYLTMNSDGILRKPSNSKRFQICFRKFQGRRPLSLCQTSNGSLYFGEYFGNPKRRAVRIFRSLDDGVSWHCRYEFPPGAIRHVHGLTFDPYRNGIWVFTGDFGQEAQIGWTDDEFCNYDIVVQRDQQSRVCGGIVRPEGLYFGTDTPDEQNYLYFLNPITQQTRVLQEVQQSVFFCGEAANAMFFTTVVEPSSYHSTNAVHVWYSTNGNTWENDVSVEQDGWPLAYFQYSSVYISRGPASHPQVFLSFQATKGTDGGCLILERS